jgi:anti-sigma regulatory factor (Ser/Thr protein kinase)
VPELEAQLQIPPVSTGIGEARRFTRDQMKIWGLAGIADNAILMISELVTNAILHGGEGAVLTLLADDLKIRAEVRDSSPAMPVVRSYSETATTGRGMVIVDALASVWGTYAVDGGKVVWFELATGGLTVNGATNDQSSEAARPSSQRSSSAFRKASPGHPDSERFRPTSRYLFGAPAPAAL